jgi:Subtilase family
VAPGKSVYSARADPAFTGECDDTSSAGIVSKSGTSMATPVTAGTAAMVRQYFEEGWHINGKRNTTQGLSPRASLVKAVILNGWCRLLLLTFEQPKAHLTYYFCVLPGASAIVGVDNEATQSILASTLYDIHQGFGRVNLLNSLPLAGKNKIRALFVNSKSMRTGNSDYYEVVIDTSSSCDHSLSVTLVWSMSRNAFHVVACTVICCC